MQVFRNRESKVHRLDIVLAIRVMVERMDQNASFGSLARNIRYLEKIL